MKLLIFILKTKKDFLKEKIINELNKKKIKILDLFSGTQSVYKAIKNLNYDFDYKGLDIFSPQRENIIFDLSQENIIPKLLKLLKKWKPDFIWASPPCYAFSRATCINGGTLAFELKNRKLKIRTNFKQVKHQQYIKFAADPKWQKKQQKKGILGLRMIENTIKIIKYFNVPFAIENPATALSRFIFIDQYNLFSRKTHYCKYGFKYKKDTYIYSNNFFLNLKVCDHPKHKIRLCSSDKEIKEQPKMANNTYRSQIPPKLIKDILKQLLLKSVKKK